MTSDAYMATNDNIDGSWAAWQISRQIEKENEMLQRTSSLLTKFWMLFLLLAEIERNFCLLLFLRLWISSFSLLYFYPSSCVLPTHYEYIIDAHA